MCTSVYVDQCVSAVHLEDIVFKQWVCMSLAQDYLYITLCLIPGKEEVGDVKQNNCEGGKGNKYKRGKRFFILFFFVLSSCVFLYIILAKKMNTNTYLQKSSIKSRSDEKKSIGRKVSIATTASRPTIVTKKIISPTVSTSRRPSTPLSIAERFMSSNYDPEVTSQNTIITKKEDDKEADLTAIDNRSLKTSSTVTPKNQNDRLSVYSPPPLFLSFDPRLESTLRKSLNCVFIK